MFNSPANQFKEFCKSPYAWPGGYPLFAITTDGGALCKTCSKDNYRLIRESQNTSANDGWQVAAIDVNWEDNDLFCDHCSAQIESAYGESA